MRRVLAVIVCVLLYIYIAVCTGRHIYQNRYDPAKPDWMTMAPEAAVFGGIGWPIYWTWRGFFWSTDWVVADAQVER